MYFDPDAIRIRVGTDWTELDVISEVGVAYTRRGYVPAIRVMRGSVEHLLLCGALSLAEPLERIRVERGQLEGISIRVKRESAQPTSKYVVEEA